MTNSIDDIAEECIKEKAHFRLKLYDQDYCPYAEVRCPYLSHDIMYSTNKVTHFGCNYALEQQKDEKVKKKWFRLKTK